MDKSRNYLALKKFAQGEGADLFGVADIRGIKHDFLLSAELLKNFAQAVCLGVRLSKSILEEIVATPTKLYFHHYRTVNVYLDQLALKVANYIQKKGFRSLPVPASQILDWESQKGHLSHKQIGYLAGLGWIGRNNLLVNDKFGSCFRMTTVLTDLPLKADRPLKKDCGNCYLCVKICPSLAIKENPSDFEHEKCFEKLKEFQRQKIVDQYICGICLKVCPGKK